MGSFEPMENSEFVEAWADRKLWPIGSSKSVEVMTLISPTYLFKCVHLWPVLRLSPQPSLSPSPPPSLSPQETTSRLGPNVHTFFINRWEGGSGFPW